MKKLLICASTRSHLLNFHLPCLRALSAHGWEIWAASDSGEPVPYAAHSVALPFRKRLPSPRNLLAVLELRRLLKRERFDLVSAHTTLAGVAARLAALTLFRRPRVLYTCHGYLFGEGDGPRKWVYLLPEILCAPVTDLLLVMNAEDEEIARRRRLGRKIRLIPGMGFDGGRFSPLPPEERACRRLAAGFAPSETVFLCAAEFSARKNQRLLIRAFAAADLPGARLLLAGDGAERENCRALAASLGVAERVMFPGKVAEMAALCPLCDAVATASRAEGLPFHLMEGMSCGLAAAVSDIKGHRELVAPGETGLLCPAGDVDAFAEAMRFLARHPEERAQYGAAARERAARFSLDRVLPELMDAYAQAGGTARLMTGEDAPRLSVLMGVYHQGADTAALEAAVRSVLAQDFRDFELLIEPDGSSEEADALLDRLAAEDGRIRLLRGGEARSLPEKLNVCLRHARGEYLARMDDDDLSLPGRFTAQTAFLDGHPEVAFVGCNVLLMRAGGAPAGERRFPESPAGEDFLFSMPFVHPALLLRGSALEAVGGYSESRRQTLCEDYDLLLRLYARGLRGQNLQTPLLRYRLPPEGDSRRRYRHRVNEAVTRFARFSELGMLPGALPYVVKPLIVGLLPRRLLARLKEKREKDCG